MHFRTSIPPHLPNFVMALRQHVEWGPEEVAVGYDLSSIFGDEGNNTTASVISSVVNNTDQANPAINFTAGLSNIVRDVVVKVVTYTINATTTTPSTLANSTMTPPLSSTPSTVSTIVKRVVEQLTKEPNIPVATVCIYLVFYSVLYIQYLHSLCMISKIYNYTILYISNNTTIILIL